MTWRASIAASRSASALDRQRVALYDLLARIVALHMPVHIPGNPSVIVQNPADRRRRGHGQPAFALGPKDGTVIGVPLNSAPAAPLLQPSAAHYDSAKLIWLGSVTSHAEPYVAYVWHTAAVQSLLPTS